nr:hypothetical protein [Tanacetum cinerariifolium]
LFKRSKKKSKFKKIKRLIRDIGKSPLEDQAANTRYWKIPAYYDDDDDEKESNFLKDNDISELPSCSAVTPNEPVNSLIMGDEHL